MKRIEYIMPIDYLRGSISGSQDLRTAYDGGSAYDVPIGQTEGAAGYQPIIVTKVARLGLRSQLRFFQVRTRSSVTMSAAMHRNLALMGGSGALFASLVSDKTSAIYSDCFALVPKGETFRAFIMPILRAGLAAKAATIVVGANAEIVNPWVSSAAPNVPVSQTILDKFASELSNS